MRYILDTHTIIWLAINSPILSKSTKKAIFDKDNEFFVSIASAWETAIKVGTGKLKLDGGVSDFSILLTRMASNYSQ